MRDDSGFGLIESVLVSLVVVGLGTIAFRASMHSADSSARLRHRDVAVHAAEAGIDRFYEYLERADPRALSCTLPPESLSTASFTVTAVYYADANATSQLACPPATIPAAASITSVGTAGSSSTTRRMESLVRLTVNTMDALTDGAVYARRDATFTGQTQVIGNPDDADVYSGEDLKLDGGGTIFGAAEAQGTLTISGGTAVKKHATSRLQLEVKGSSIVWGDGTSTTAGVVNNGTINGDAYHCTGAAPGGTIGGDVVQRCPDPAGPQDRPFPAYTYDAYAWDAAGYTITTFTDCGEAREFLLSPPAGSNVVRIASACELKLVNAVVPVTGDLAIVADGEITLTGASSFAGTPPSSAWKLYLFAKVSTPAPCTTAGYTMTGGSLTGAVQTLIYTPCEVTFTGGSFSQQGQVIGGTVRYTSTTSLTYAPVPVPGVSRSALQVAIAYVREIV